KGQVNTMDKLAVDGGQPVREKPFPRRTPFGTEEIKQVTEAIESQNLFALPGNKVKRFEEDFANKYGMEYAIASTSGTSAIHLAVAAINPEPGSEIIAAPVTDYGTVAGLIYQGCVPVFADWTPGAFNMDPGQIERNITGKTAAIIVVHLFGNPCDMDAIMKIGRKHKLPVIEDCCQAYCTPYKGKWVGTIGDIGCFSMQQSKHLTAGEGGVTITNNADYAMRMGLFKDKGWESRGRWGPRAYAFLGLNYRMNELTGAVALAQLQKVENVVAQRHTLGELITGRIKDIKGITPAPVTPGGWHSYWLYPFTITGFPAERFVEALKAEGIPANWGYTGKPIYLCTEGLKKKRTFGSSGYPFDSPYYGKKIEYEEGLCPVAEKELSRVTTLELNEDWTTADAEDAAAAIRKVAENLK
ncbi:MAG: DegT/DnrJ/EryC1/StrS family aminotransferase, partial [Phycisphaerae bacterium]|nr:DegT/DnrJ/EryC1/StrS family aminotransferase [Phycisphaerae bacterium]